MLSLFTPTRSASAAVYPDLRPLRRALKAKRWTEVSSYFRQRGPGTDTSIAAGLVSEIDGVEKWLREMCDTHRDDPLPRLLLGVRQITLAWKARTGFRAQYVGREQFAVFHTLLFKADRLLGEVIADEPNNVAAWTYRLDTARGLGFGLDEAWRRYGRAAENCATPYLAQRKMTQQLCPKWGGSNERVLAFVRQCLDQTPDGGICGSVVAEGHLEVALDEGDLGRFSRAEVIEDLWKASERILHPSYDAPHGWVAAHGALAAGFWLGEQKEAAKPHFKLLNNKFSWYPWAMLGVNERTAFRKARFAVLAR